MGDNAEGSGRTSLHLTVIPGFFCNSKKCNSQKNKNPILQKVIETLSGEWHR
jgi:hypothetical protein